VHILNDFFLLAWNEDFKLIDDLDDRFKCKINELFKQNRDDFCDSSAILLIISSENFEKIINIPEIKSVFDGIFLDEVIEKHTVLQVQKELLGFLVHLGEIPINKDIKNRFEQLRKEGVISYYVSRRLISLLALIKEKKVEKVTLQLQKAKEDKLYYKNSINILSANIHNLNKCVESSAYKQRLQIILEKLEKQRFSVGVTGVMNAGKSTMLNALLGREILGTSVVPETANLTVLKYSLEEHAKVNYWNQKEFKKITDSVKDDKSIEKFVKETKKYFGNELDKYITDIGKSENVKVEDLSLYTSVKESNKKCNLIKSVELFSNLKFLKDGVEIVDTPGLDDPIIEREKITLDYVSDCDLLVHLMNASQSATKKDVDFIIDSIIYQNISRLLVVITRIDTVNQSELEEVINYTKSSIRQRLSEQNRENKLDLVISKIDFIPISAKIALLQKLGLQDEVKKIGFDVNRNGIDKIENYLDDVLFGKQSEKATLIINNNLSELSAIYQNAMYLFDEEEKLLNKSNDEIKQDYEAYKDKKEELTFAIESVKSDIKHRERELKSYFKTLEKFSFEKLVDLKNIIKSRVIDDVSYEVRKNKTIPKQERIRHMVEIGIKDGLVDLIRDYRYEFQKKMSLENENIKLSFNQNKILLNFAQDDEFKNREFDSEEFFDKYFQHFIVFDNQTILLKNIYDMVKKYKKNLGELEISLDLLLKDEVKKIDELLIEKLKDVNTELLDTFIALSKNKIDLIETNMKIKDDMIEKSMQNLRKNKMDKKQRLEIIKTKKEALEDIKNSLNSIKQASK